MSKINSSIEIDADEIITAVVESSDFDSAVEDAIGNYDFSYTFDSQMEDKIDNLEYIDKYDLPHYVLEMMQNNEDIQHEIRLAAGQTQTAQPTTPEGLLEVIALLHKVCGAISQQMAVINALTGVNPWPNFTGESLHKIGSLLEQMGYIPPAQDA
jgi:hypothetical protein